MPFRLPAGSELIVILVIVVLLFGVGRIGQIGKEMGSAIREFRKGLGGDANAEKKPEQGSQSGDGPASNS